MFVLLLANSQCKQNVHSHTTKYPRCFRMMKYLVKSWKHLISAYVYCNFVPELASKLNHLNHFNFFINASSYVVSLYFVLQFLALGLFLYTFFFLGGSAFCDSLCALTARSLLWKPWTRWMNCEIVKAQKYEENQNWRAKNTKKRSNSKIASNRTRRKQADDRKTVCSFFAILSLNSFSLLIIFVCSWHYTVSVNILCLADFKQRFSCYLWQKEGIMSKICAEILERFEKMGGLKLEMI